MTFRPVVRRLLLPGWTQALLIWFCSELHVFSGWPVLFRTGLAEPGRWIPLNQDHLGTIPTSAEGVRKPSLGLGDVWRRTLQCVPWFSDGDRSCTLVAERKNTNIFFLAFLLWESCCRLDEYSSAWNWCHADSQTLGFSWGACLQSCRLQTELYHSMHLCSLRPRPHQ